MDITLGAPKPHFANMASNPTAKPVRSRPSLTALPRETRNQVYQELLVSPKPIKVCYDHDSLWLYLRVGRQNGEISIEFLCHAVQGSELAQEVYEEFFRNNTFDCGCSENLRRFLTTTTTRFNFQNNLFPNTTNHGYLKFDNKPWIRKVKVSIFCDVWNRKASKDLTYIMKCPNLQRIEITIIGLTTGTDKINPVDWTIEAIVKVCKSIRGKVGGGLIVRAQKDWTERGSAFFSNLELEDVSWMWEVPSEEAKRKVKDGLGTHKEKIQVLISTGWAVQKGKVGAWAEHWRQEHNEQQQLMRLRFRKARGISQGQPTQ